MTSRVPCVLVCLFFTLGAPSLSAQPEGSVPTPEEEAPGARESTCRDAVEAFARSGARKLFRALDGHNIPIVAIDWTDTIELPLSGDLKQSLAFRVHREKKGQAVALVGRGVETRTFVVVDTTLGPVVARLGWPNLDAIEKREACEPDESSVVHPDVATSTIDVTPFEFWGLRVFWRLPPSFNPGGSPDGTPPNPREALKAALNDSS